MPLTGQDFDDTERMDGITLNPTKKNGQPATVQAGSVVATVQIGDVTTEVVNDQINIISGTPGAYEVRVDADADLGDGVTIISDTVNGTINGSLATNLGLTAGTVRPK